MTTPSEPNAVHDLDVGQAAFFDSYVDILPNNMDSSVWHGSNNISDVLAIFQDRLNEELLGEIGGQIVEESPDGEHLWVANNIEGVAYVLQCDTPRTDNILKRKTRRALNQRSVPSWVWAAYNAASRVYIGGTYRPDTRIQEHLGESYEYEGSVFTEIFEPVGIKALLLSLGDSPYDLEEMEAEFWREDPATFVFQA